MATYSEAAVAIIGGTGAGQFPLDEGPEEVAVTTPWGTAMPLVGRLRGHTDVRGLFWRPKEWERLKAAMQGRMVTAEGIITRLEQARLLDEQTAAINDSMASGLRSKSVEKPQLASSGETPHVDE